MKQPEDNKTIDMLDPAKRRRGRPESKSKLSDAQRQEARRARLREAGKGFISAAVDAGIIERIDHLRRTTGAEKNDIIEGLLRQALAMEAPTAQGAE